MKTQDYFDEIGAWPRHSARRMVIGYTIGFVLSLALTFVAYLVATHVAVSPVIAVNSTVGILLLLALSQFIVQAIFFLHLGTGRSSRVRLAALGFAITIILILVIGSLWIMTHLNERMMADPAQMQQYMDNQQGI